jgi:hypothetical protein
MFLRTSSTQLIPPGIEGDEAMPETAADLDVKAISEPYFEAWAARDVDAIMELHTEDTRFWTHAGGEPARGRDAVRAEFAQIFQRFPEFSYETHRVLYGEDFWVLDWALINGDVRFDCVDIVNVSPEGLVARKDTFIDMVQLQATMPEVAAEAADAVAEEKS